MPPELHEKGPLTNFAASMETTTPIQIDLDAILRSRLPRYSRFIPHFLVNRLKKIICQNELNEMLRRCHGKRDDEFCRGVIDHLGITYTVEGADNLPESPRFIAVSNHPLGGLDGMILIDYFSRRYDRKVKFIVNDLLMAIEPLSGVFIPINKHGSQSREYSRLMDRAMESDDPVIIFPAGLCSRKGDDGKVADLRWQKNFINKAIHNHRDIIPMRFDGENSSFFYNFARLRTRLGLKFNIEMIRLPREVFLSAGKHFTIRIGTPVSWQTLKGGRSAQSEADTLRQLIYKL